MTHRVLREIFTPVRFQVFRISKRLFLSVALFVRFTLTRVFPVDVCNAPQCHRILPLTSSPPRPLLSPASCDEYWMIPNASTTDKTQDIGIRQRSHISSLVRHWSTGFIQTFERHFTATKSKRLLIAYTDMLLALNSILIAVINQNNNNNYYYYTVRRRYESIYYTHAVLTVVLPDEHGLACSPWDSLAVILFNTVPPCPSQTGEGTAVKEEERRERTSNEVQSFYGWMPSCCQPLELILSSTTDSWGKWRRSLLGLLSGISTLYKFMYLNPGASEALHYGAI